MAIAEGRLIIQVIISLLEILLYGGLQYGWASFLYVLKQENVFEDLCVNDTNTTSDTDDGSSGGCFAQDEKLNLLFSIGLTLFSFSGLICGKLYSQYFNSTRKIRTCSMFVFVAGVLCFGFTSPALPWLVLPGIVFVGVAGISLLISNMQIAVLLPKGSSVYVGLLNGCFDSSVVTQMAVKALYESGISPRYSYIGVAILCVVISGLCTLLHPGSKDGTSKSSDNSDNHEKGRNGDVKLPEGSINVAFNNDEKHLKDPSPSFEKGAADNTPPSVKHKDVTSTSVRSIICSWIYIFHLIWLSALLLRFYYFIGSINMLMVQILESDDQVSYFTDVMTYTMLGGMISSFIAGQVFEAQNRWFTGTMKTVIPLTVTSCLAILLSSLAFLPSSAVLYADFVVLTFFRSFVFSVNMDFVIISFPQKFMSLLFGLVLSISGVVTLTQYALFTWTKKYDSAMTHVNIFLLCLSVISLLHPLLVFMSEKRKSIHKGVNMNIE